jgi:hypothetical protein
MLLFTGGRWSGAAGGVTGLVSGSAVTSQLHVHSCAEQVLQLACCGVAGQVLVLGFVAAYTHAGKQEEDIINCLCVHALAAQHPRSVLSFSARWGKVSHAHAPCERAGTCGVHTLLSCGFHFALAGASVFLTGTCARSPLRPSLCTWWTLLWRTRLTPGTCLRTASCLSMD